MQVFLIEIVILLNLGLLLIGIGMGVLIALILASYTSLKEGALCPASIFIMAGIALLVGFKITKKIDN